MKKILLIVVLSFLVCRVVNAANITGTWEGYIKSNLGYAEITMEIEQDNGTFSGTWESSEGGYGSLSGKIKGKSLKFSVYNETEGCTGTFTGKGTLSNNGNIISYSLSGSDCDGSWKGKGKMYFQD